jgi:hypothetical protein
MFKRRRRTVAPTAVPDVGVSSVAVRVGPAADVEFAVTREEAWRLLRRIVAEALIMQDAAEALLLELRDERNLGAVAPPAGRLMNRFIALGQQLPSCGDPVMDRHTELLRRIFDHHVLMLNSARALLAAEWSSERLSAQIDRIDGLGAPARTLEAVRREILDHAVV